MPNPCRASGLIHEYVAQTRECVTKRPAFHRAQASYQALLVDSAHLVEGNKTVLPLEIDQSMVANDL